MKVVLYARCSTKDKGQDPETQLLPLRDFARLKNHEVLGEYVDRGWSGAKERRPQLDRLMADGRKHRFDAVLVARFDRFARSVTHLLAALAEFQKLKIDFISLNESIDTSTAMGRLVFTILAAVGEMERALIRERVLAGMDRARRQGKHFGRPRVEVSFTELAGMRQEGTSIYAIAKAKGIARSTVRAVLERGDNACAER